MSDFIQVRTGLSITNTGRQIDSFPYISLLQTLQMDSGKNNSTMAKLDAVLEKTTHFAG